MSKQVVKPTDILDDASPSPLNGVATAHFFAGMGLGLVAILFGIGVLFIGFSAFSSRHEQLLPFALLAVAVLAIGMSGYLIGRMHRSAGAAARKHPTLEREIAARAKAERANAAKSKLLATVSHDIRTPLSGIAGMSHLLGQTRLTPEQRNYLAGIRQSSNALGHLVDDLLDFASLEAGRFQLRPQDASIRMLVESVVEMLAHRAHEKGIEVASWVSSDVPELMSFDPDRMRQVLFNVIGNAVKFTQIGGVFVEVVLDQNDFTITVEDTGPGMSAAEQKRVFGEFEQAGSLAAQSAGTGLGLPISARIIAECGGSISLASAKDKGSVFTISMPAVASQEFGVRAGRNSVLSGSRVLVVSPPGPSARALVKTIETLGGECYLAHDCDEAEHRLTALAHEAKFVTDLIADNRVASGFSNLIAQKPGLGVDNARRIFLVDPEHRNSKVSGIGYDSWLVRPLRERSLIDVLLGRMKGIELRDPLNDNRVSDQSSRFTHPSMPGLDILLAEDDPVNALLIKAVLSKAGHRVSTVDSFQTLVEQATDLQKQYDLIITDLAMPGGSGVDAIRAIRRIERDADASYTPIFVVTGQSDEDVLAAVDVAGADKILQKPVDPEELTGLIAKLSMRNRRIM